MIFFLLTIYGSMILFSFLLDKTHFEVPVFLFFFHISSLYFYFETLYHCTFIFHIDFVLHNLKIVDQGFFFQLLTFILRLASHNYTSVVLLQHFLLLPFFFSDFLSTNPNFFFKRTTNSSS